MVTAFLPLACDKYWRAILFSSARQRGDIPQTRRRPGAGRGNDEIRELIKIFELTGWMQANGFRSEVISPALKPR